MKQDNFAKLLADARHDDDIEPLAQLLGREIFEEKSNTAEDETGKNYEEDFFVAYCFTWFPDQVERFNLLDEAKKIL